MEPDATRKRPRAASGGGGGLAVDRLSDLPDCLLHAIMSFMKARQVVQTCVLSKRWENLWRTVPCLDVDHQDFRKTGATIHDEVEAWENFEDFVDILLLSHEIARLDAFRLHVNNVTSYGYASWGRQAWRWIRRSIKHYSGNKVHGIPRLGLSSNSSWRLRRLHLSNIYLDDLFAKHIGSRCPSLEDLDLNGCIFALDEIASHSLKSLVIDNCYSTRYNTKLVVKTPAIASLRLALNLHCLTGGLFVNEMPSLSAASVSVLDNSKGAFQFHDRWKFLVSLCNVTTLVLSDFQTVVITEEPVELPEFKNLKILSLDKCDLSDNFQLLMQFLQKSPKLEKLTLWRCKLTEDSNKMDVKAKQKKTPFKLKKTSLGNIRCENLKLTEIIYNDDYVLQLVELLLGNSANLPKNTIKLIKA